MNETDQQPSSHLVDAYNRMMATIRHTFEETDTSDTSLQQALEDAREQIVHLGEVTAEEASEISEFIKRDINDAAEYMMQSSAEFQDWLKLDIEIMERKIVDLFLSVADRTRVELEQLQHHSPEPGLYYSGEITGPGTLQCTECGELVPFVTTAHIDICPQCGNNTFSRATKTAQ